jgi:hypothetical protein
MSDTPLSNTIIFDGTTIAGLGITPGNFVWTWGSGTGDQTFTVDVVPLPATLPLLGAGLGALGLLGWRRKRLAVAVA